MIGCAILRVDELCDGKMRLVPHFEGNFEVGHLVKLGNGSQIRNLRFE